VCSYIYTAPYVVTCESWWLCSTTAARINPQRTPLSRAPSPPTNTQTDTHIHLRMSTTAPPPHTPPQAFPVEVLDVGSERESARACSTRFELQETVHDMSWSSEFFFLDYVLRFFLDLLEAFDDMSWSSSVRAWLLVNSLFLLFAGGKLSSRSSVRALLLVDWVLYY
jgi:hypothetical protein